MIPTYYLMKKLEKQYPDSNLYFIIGADLVKSLITWDEGENLKKEIKFLIM